MFQRCTSLLAPVTARTARWLLLAAGSLTVASAMAAPLEVLNPQGQLQPISNLVWQAPPAALMQFEVQGKVKSIPFQTRAQLDWRPQGQRYEAAQEVQIPLLGSRRQSSVGSITPQGLQPELFIDRSRKEHSTTLDAQAGLIRFSRSGETLPWQAGTQDRISVFFQVAGMLAAAPQRYPAGTEIRVHAVSSSRLAVWTFKVHASETLKLPAGTLPAVRLQHLSDHKDDDQQSSLWLAPSLGYLPVRIHMLENGGRDELDLKLKSHARPE